MRNAASNTNHSRLGWLAAAVCAVMFVFAAPVRATLISGTGSTSDGWNFDTERVVTDLSLSSPADIFFVQVITDWRIRTRGSATLMALPGQIYADLISAPSDESGFAADVPLLFNTTYVIKTQEGKYAKFVITGESAAAYTFNYVFQDDGTRVLGIPATLDEQTWGRLKRLYSLD